MSSGLHFKRQQVSRHLSAFFYLHMLFAHNHLGEKIEATPGLQGWCPLCTGELIAKCGSINIWHWAHESESTTLQCIHEKETEWHMSWKSYFDRDCQEVVITHPTTGEKKIADATTPTGTVIEFQHSPISAAEIAARENHYGNMIWIFDLRDAFDNDRLQLDMKQRRIWWGRHKPSLLAAKKDFYFDIGDGRLLRPHNVYNQKPGWMSADVGIETVSSFIWEHSSMLFNQHEKIFGI